MQMLSTADLRICRSNREKRIWNYGSRANVYHWNYERMALATKENNSFIYNLSLSKRISNSSLKDSTNAIIFLLFYCCKESNGNSIFRFDNSSSFSFF